MKYLGYYLKSLGISAATALVSSLFIALLFWDIAVVYPIFSWGFFRALVFVLAPIFTIAHIIDEKRKASKESE